MGCCATLTNATSSEATSVPVYLHEMPKRKTLYGRCHLTLTYSCWRVLSARCTYLWDYECLCMTVSNEQCMLCTVCMCVCVECHKKFSIWFTAHSWSRRIFAFHAGWKASCKIPLFALTRRISQKLILYGGIHIACYLLGISIERVCVRAFFSIFGHFVILAAKNLSQFNASLYNTDTHIRINTTSKILVHKPGNAMCWLWVRSQRTYGTTEPGTRNKWLFRLHFHFDCRQSRIRRNDIINGFYHEHWQLSSTWNVVTFTFHISVILSFWCMRFFQVENANSFDRIVIIQCPSTEFAITTSKWIFSFLRS